MKHLLEVIKTAFDFLSGAKARREAKAARNERLHDLVLINNELQRLNDEYKKLNEEYRIKLEMYRKRLEILESRKGKGEQNEVYEVLLERQIENQMMLVEAASIERDLKEEIIFLKIEIGILKRGITENKLLQHEQRSSFFF